MVLAPLRAELGGPQMAINLADGLRSCGVSASLWSPYPLPSGLGSRLTIPFARRALERYLETARDVDVVDAPPHVLTGKMTAGRLTVARSTQPEIQYRLVGPSPFITGSAVRRARDVVMHYSRGVDVIGRMVSGWARADRILCLGSLEYRWMQNHFPWWRRKTSWYVNALSQSDRARLADIRSTRQPRVGGARRFLWIGRFTPHKGVGRLLEYIDVHLRRRMSDSFTIAGCGAEGLKQPGRDVLGDPRVRVIPAYSREELFPMLAEHDIGLFTSVTEGWGLSLNEMLESGMPVYATSVGGVPDMQPYFGSMLRPFPPGHDDRFSTGIEIRRYEEYQSRFSWRAIAKWYVEWITQSRAQTWDSGR